jgi:hypothetical protein
MIFLVMNDIDVHQLNLRSFRSLQFLVENHSKINKFALLKQ